MRDEVSDGSFAACCDEGPPSWLVTSPPLEDPPALRPVPEVPAVLLEGPLPWQEPVRCDCEDCPSAGAPGPWSALVTDQVGVLAFSTGATEQVLGATRAAWLAAQQAKALLWRNTAALHAQVLRVHGEGAAQHVSSELALLLGISPRSADGVLAMALRCAQAPELLVLMEAGRVSEPQVRVLFDELERWTSPSDDLSDASALQPADGGVVLRLLLDRCAEDYPGQWPSPAALRRRVAAAALTVGLRRTVTERQRVSERRTAVMMQTGADRASLVVEGHVVSVAQMKDAIDARAEALGRLPGDTRTLDQRRFDAAYELLTVDSLGGPSTVPTLDDTGELIALDVRGVEVHVVVPDLGPSSPDADQGDEGPDGDQPPPPPGGSGGWRGTWGELPEIAGVGPITPDLALELLRAGSRVCLLVVDPTTGMLRAVDDPTPPPRPPTRARAPVDVEALLNQVRGAPVHPADRAESLSTTSYRPGAKLRRFLAARDRTCAFPGCTVPAARTDVDHVTPHHHGGPTSPDNTHSLCRRHHRAKQSPLLTVTRHGRSTVWTTRDGRQHAGER